MPSMLKCRFAGSKLDLQCLQTMWNREVGDPFILFISFPHEKGEDPTPGKGALLGKSHDWQRRYDLLPSASKSSATLNATCIFQSVNNPLHLSTLKAGKTLHATTAFSILNLPLPTLKVKPVVSETGLFYHWDLQNYHLLLRATFI